MKIEHLAFNVPEASRMAHWYVENLGLKIVRNIGDPNQTTFIGDDDSETVIEIYTNPAADIPDYASINPLILHIAFAVPDIDAERQRLVAAGASVEGATNTLPNGDQLAFLRDPWGMTIQLTQRVNPLV